MDGSCFGRETMVRLIPWPVGSWGTLLRDCWLPFLFEYWFIAFSTFSFLGFRTLHTG